MEDEDRIVCFCNNVTLSQLKEAIREGAKTIPLIQEKTLASTGCGGCEWDVQEILVEMLAAESPTK